MRRGGREPSDRLRTESIVQLGVAGETDSHCKANDRGLADLGLLRERFGGLERRLGVVVEEVPGDPPVVGRELLEVRADAAGDVAVAHAPLLQASLRIGAIVAGGKKGPGTRFSPSPPGTRGRSPPSPPPRRPPMAAPTGPPRAPDPPGGGRGRPPG